jgi:MFS transporter, DHA3 family, multidrug efflux protein
MQTFYRLLAYALITLTTNNFVWFAVTFWIYIQTQSVISTGVLAGIYLIFTAFSGFWLGSLVDHFKKKSVMLGGSLFTLIFYLTGTLIYTQTPISDFTSVTSPMLWILVLVLMSGVIAGNILNIAIPTLVTYLIKEDRRDRANGLYGTTTGISFTITSIASGLVLGFFGMFWVLILAIGFTLLALIYLSFLKVTEKKTSQLVHQAPEDIKSELAGHSNEKGVDIKGTIKLIKSIPGLFPLIFFTTFNNFLGGVFFALMDAYGLTMVNVQTWGILWGFLSLGFILGGLIIAKKGLGVNPVRTLLLANIVIWTVCIFFTVQPSIILLFIGCLIWITLIPFIEASEQTVVQKVVPPERQGRVFGFAQSMEQGASPLSAFMVGPIAQLIFIPFMTTGAGVELIGDWFGVGVGRGIALTFIISGIIGLIVTVIAIQSPSYKLLSKRYQKG